MTKNIRAFTMPKWGIEMEEGVIREWHAKVGDKVNEGDIFVVIETDKIANDVELEFSSTLRWRIDGEGDAYPVGALISIFAEESVTDEEVEVFRNSFEAVDASFANSKESEGSINTSTENTKVPLNLSISPMAKELAENLGVDLTSVEGSGRKGRVSLQDVEQAAKAQGLYSIDNSDENNPHEVIKLTSMRKTIAKRLTEANRDIPHFYLRCKINMDNLIKSRETNKQGSINDYVLKACAIALKAEPDVNVNFMGETIHRFKHADISVAVATDRGLITPIIRSADDKTISEISSEMKELGHKAKNETLQPSDYQGGTFSLSNLGMMGISSFDAVVNPPMAAILAVGSLEETVLPNGECTKLMNVTLSCDHRAIDGVLGAKWLQAFREALESPENL
ncbi:MAG: dihydrolipoamide acetyltransferase family protein [Hellea sp.]|nr:dihydrolipoamide acetyltransferase family protein [Hellea sp.]MDG2362363.1 dihydrolipoamide acetyltransferase family protein [Hellea sp.]